MTTVRVASLVPALVAAAAVAGCGIADLQPAPPRPRPVDDSFVVYGGAYGASGTAEDVARMPDGDLVVVGCESGTVEIAPGPQARGRDDGRSTFVTRIDRETHRARWTRRSSSPCGVGDNWTVPRVAVSSTGTIWVAASGWGRGPFDTAPPMALLAFDGTGGLGAQRDLPLGVRVRAMATLPGDRVAIAGQSAIVHDRASAFVAAIDATAAEVWRRDLPGSHVMLVESLTVDADRILVGGHVDSTIEVIDGVGRGRESDGFVMTLDTAGAIASTITRHFPGVNVYDVRVAVADGHTILAYKLGLRVGNPWPAELPTGPASAFGGILVERLTAQPWRRLFTGTTHASVMGLAATGDRLALVLGFQAGTFDVGRGPWKSTMFNVGAYVELATATGDLLDARQLATSGDHARAFFRRVIWDGGAFTAVGEVRGTITAPRTVALEADAAFVWRVGVTKVVAVPAEDDETRVAKVAE